MPNPVAHDYHIPLTRDAPPTGNTLCVIMMRNVELSSVQYDKLGGHLLEKVRLVKGDIKLLEMLFVCLYSVCPLLILSLSLSLYR